MPASFCAALTTPPSPCTIIFTSLNFFGKHKTLIFYPNVCPADGHCHAQSRLFLALGALQLEAGSAAWKGSAC